MVIDIIIPPLVDPSTKKPEPSAAELAFSQRLDDLVRQWIYGTISIDLLNTIADPDDKAVDAWKRLENFFLNNKAARAMTLDAQFTNTKLEQFDGVKPYCSHLKTLADNLRNVGDTVSGHEMALQLLKGLTDDYKSFRSSVRHLDPLPFFEALCSMLELEEQSNASDIPDSGEEALLSQTSQPASFPQQGRGISATDSARGGAPPARGGQKIKGKGGKKSSTGSGGRHNQSQQSAPQAQPSAQHSHSGQQGWMYPPPWAYWSQPPWATPPCPYPSQGQGPMQWGGRPQSQQPDLLGARP
ncbi:uncharacterized protein LOC110706430 [Chenopodium quinoa]|uniref:uncharacterized protein LOC110706430 n=1 Tax=Chenopodium quinoa TaxID=63459 RepID=UPI000B77837F|nr:uncharacterized protein LOC110706430 [Chenopodium quinoa]